MNKKFIPIGSNDKSSKKTTSDTPEFPREVPLRRNTPEESLDDVYSGVESFEVDPRTVIYPDTD